MADRGIKNIPDPDPRILRMQYAGKQKAGEIQPTGCSHPCSALEQMVDDMGYVHRQGRPTNLLYCSICKVPLRIVAYDGVEAADG